MIGIYKITSPNNRVYIGQSVNIEKRFKQYKKLKCHSQVRLYNSFLKHGVENHSFEIVCECETSDMNNKERYYQDIYMVLGKKGLNCILTKSSDKNGKRMVETLIKMSNSNKGKKLSDLTKLKISKYQTGRLKSAETKAKMSKPKSKETREKMRLAQQNISKEIRDKISKSNSKLVLDMSTGIFFYSVKEAADSFNLNYNTIKTKLNGSNKVNNTNLRYV